MGSRRALMVAVVALGSNRAGHSAVPRVFPRTLIFRAPGAHTIDRWGTYRGSMSRTPIGFQITSQSAHDDRPPTERL